MGTHEIGHLDALIDRPTPLRRGQRLFHAARPGDHVYAVRSGSLKTVVPMADGADQIVAFHLPADIVGLDAIGDGHYLSDAIALERTSVCAIPVQRLHELAADLPALQRQLHRIVARQLRRHQEHLAAVGRGSARERIALFIRVLAGRLADVGYPADELHLTMPRADIANHLGLAVATVSRALRQLSDEGVLAIDGRRIRILEPRLIPTPERRSRAPARTGTDQPCA